VRPAGLTNAEGKPKYTGLHTLRHFYASWRINADRGGQGLPAKEVSSGSAQLVSSGHDIDRVQFASLKKLVSQNGGPSPFLP
jgi:hypothetical protein